MTTMTTTTTTTRGLDGRSVLVLGLGESGLAMARWCLREGARVRVADTREAPPMLADLRASAGDIDVRLGPFDAALLVGIDLLAISPGLSPIAEPQRSLLAAAKERAVPVVSEIELFARKLASLKTDDGYAPRLVAITGTNGKTTVTRLVGRMAASTGRRVAVAGNVSPAALDALAEALDRHAEGEPLPDVWVLELSSFQLDATTSLQSDSATVLNVTQDHLDWHGSMDAYAATKAAIFAPDSVRVLNRDDARVMAMAGAKTVSFGLDAPERAGDLGVVRDRDDEGLRWLALAEGDDPEAEAQGAAAAVVTGKRRIAKPVAPIVTGPVRIKRLMPTDALHLRGDHNVANVLAALALGRSIGLPMAAMLRAAAAYRGEPHRMAFVLALEGVDYIEDSKGTNVGATVAALQGLGRQVVLIAGGLGKGQDFAPLAASAARHARAVVLIGRDRDRIREAIVADVNAAGVPLVDRDSLEDAVEEAARLAQPGDAVLLSPACASFDMFRDYEHRAEVFVAAVERLTVKEAAAC
jgi:UDP-N-acetylmuramoylalanine--D-glutamate ligase